MEASARNRRAAVNIRMMSVVFIVFIGVNIPHFLIFCL